MYVMRTAKWMDSPVELTGATAIDLAHSLMPWIDPYLDQYIKGLEADGGGKGRQGGLTHPIGRDKDMLELLSTSNKDEFKKNGDRSPERDRVWRMVRTYIQDREPIPYSKVESFFVVVKSTVERDTRRMFYDTEVAQSAVGQHGKCLGCNGVFDAFLLPVGDHMVPWAEGGRTIQSNCVALCHPCNSKKGTQPLNEFLADQRALGQ
jgi:5-methylcytosine-specific restriction endonuclease McrA